MPGLDQDLLLLLNQGLGRPGLDPPMRLLSDGILWVPVAAAVAVALIARYRARGLLVVLSMGLAVGLSDPLVGLVLKPLAGRLRPCEELADAIRVAAECRGGWSLPSNHAANAAALVTAVGYGFRRFLWWLVPLALAVGVSRIYLGMHYPSDVLAGYAVGTACGTATAWAVHRVGRRWMDQDV